MSERGINITAGELFTIAGIFQEDPMVRTTLACRVLVPVAEYIRTVADDTTLRALICVPSNNTTLNFFHRTTGSVYSYAHAYVFEV